MTVRQMIGAWLLALALAGGLMLGPVLRDDRADARQRSDVVVIGSSLMAYAVPETGGGSTSLLGDGRSHRRLATLRISERQLLARLDRAIDQHTPTIFVEVNPLLIDFRDNAWQRPCDGWTYAVRVRLGEAQGHVINAYRKLHGRPPLDIFTGDPDNIARARLVDPAEVRRLYPLVLRAPCDQRRLEAAVARAKAQGSSVILILPPRSPDGDRLLGPDWTGELANRAQALAVRLGVPLFVPHDGWSNAEFIDLAHVNPVGRAHFLHALRAWWAEHQ